MQELRLRGYSEAELCAIGFQNFIRVMKQVASLCECDLFIMYQVEHVRDQLKHELASDDLITDFAQDQQPRIILTPKL